MTPFSIHAVFLFLHKYGHRDSLFPRVHPLPDNASYILTSSLVGLCSKLVMIPNPLPEMGTSVNSPKCFDRRLMTNHGTTFPTSLPPRDRQQVGGVCHANIPHRVHNGRQVSDCLTSPTQITHENPLKAPGGATERALNTLQNTSFLHFLLGAV